MACFECFKNQCFKPVLSTGIILTTYVLKHHLGYPYTMSNQGFSSKEWTVHYDYALLIDTQGFFFFRQNWLGDIYR